MPHRGLRSLIAIKTDSCDCWMIAETPETNGHVAAVAFYFRAAALQDGGARCRKYGQSTRLSGLGA